jgi:hypothetical protein
MTENQIAGMRLGKRPPVNKPALMLADFLTGVVPVVPVAADHFVGIPSWELGRNNEFGTCGPTSVANSLRLITYGLTGKMMVVSFCDIADLYRRSGNPRFNPDLLEGDARQDDNGVIMQDMLSALLKDGIGGHKPLAYAKIDPNDMDTLNKAIALFGGVNMGLDLTVAQQSQTNRGTWAYVANSTPWGGHAVLAGRYNNPDGTLNDRSGVVTWAQVVDMDRKFVTSQQDEAWVIIWPEHLGSKTFLAGVDVGALASAYQDLTGRQFPVIPTPPAPAPAPVPEPLPLGDGVADQALAAALRRYMRGSGVPRYLRKVAEPWAAKH